MDLWHDFITDPVASLESLATAGALLLTAFTLRGARRDKVRAQAEHVSAWLQADRDEWRADGRLVWGTPVVKLVIRNGSQSPIYAVTVVNSKQGADVLGFELLPPGAEQTVSGSRELLGPHDEYGTPLVLWFTDASGRAWTRGGRGGSLRRQWWRDERWPWRVLRPALPSRLRSPWRAVAVRAAESSPQPQEQPRDERERD